jgi:hypothetical protein
MTCHAVQNQLSLYLYGELDFAREEAVEQHLAGCAFCTLALNREKAWHATLHAETQDVDLALLSQCRRELNASLAAEKAWNPIRISLWQRLSEKFELSGFRWSSRLAYASFLVLLGFGAGQVAQHPGISRFLSNTSTANMASLLSGNTRVRDLQPSADGLVRLYVENVREGELVVSPDDPRVRELLVAATRDPENPAVRVESVQILMGHDGTDVRDALISSVLHDPNAAVRLKAVEGLRHFSDDMATREALEMALQRDKEPAVRAEAIEVLAPGGSHVGFTPDLIKTLQGLARQGQDDDYVRQRSRQLLDGARAGGSQMDTY